jgi:4,5-DOPA dioxygenase extradiol
MPSTAAFLGHGSPMNAIEHNRYTEAWSAFGQKQDAPTAVLCISAHWYTTQIAVTAMPQPRIIYDFSGFPSELSTFKYPAIGSPVLAERIASLLLPRNVQLNRSEWGIDHGAWSVLCHVFPKAEIPVVQLSINMNLEPQEHVAIGRSLAPLLDENIMVIGSGNIVHHLGLIDWSAVGRGATWAEEFDIAAQNLLTSSQPSDVVSLLAHPHASKAVPTLEHFLPIAYIAGIAEARGQQLGKLIGGCELGSLSMTSYALN